MHMGVQIPPTSPICPYSVAVNTPPCHGGSTGSIPVTDARYVDGSEMVITSGCGPEVGSSILLCHPIMDCSSMVERPTVNRKVSGFDPQRSSHKAT